MWGRGYKEKNEQNDKGSEDFLGCWLVDWEKALFPDMTSDCTEWVHSAFPI